MRAHTNENVLQLALAASNRSLEINPKAWWRYKRRALAQFHLGNFEEALADLRQSLLNSPTDTSALTWIDLELVANCPDDAFRTCILDLANQHVDDNSKRSGPRVVRAAIFVAFEKHDEALTDLIEVSKLDDAGYYPLYQAALLSIHLGESMHYKSLCQRMISAPFASLENENGNETHFTAWTCALSPNALDDYEPAIKLARHAVEKAPNNQQYLDGLGAIQLRAGQYDKAKEYLNKALRAGESDNTSPSYIPYFLAMTEHHLGNADAAKENLAQAIASAKKNSPARLHGIAS